MVPDDSLDFSFLDPAVKGDWDELIRHIEEGGKITDRMRAFIVAVLKGKKRPNNRPRKAAIIRRHIAIAAYVWRIQQAEGRTEAITKAADRFDMDSRSVQRILKKVETISCRHTVIGQDGRVRVTFSEYTAKRPSRRVRKPGRKR